MARPFTSGSLTLPDGGLRIGLHVKRLRKLAAASTDQHAATTLRLAADAMELMSRRNRQLGRELGQTLERQVLTAKGASLRLACPDTPAAIADLAAEQPVTAYIDHRRPARVRVTTRERLPTGVTRLGRFDISTDYRVIAAKVQSATPEAPHG